MTMRVVLDTNYAIFAPEGVFIELRARGYALSLSTHAFAEVWAHSLKTGKQRQLRIETLSRHLDPGMPLTPAGHHLAELIDGRLTLTERVLRRRATIADHRARWNAITSVVQRGALTEEKWREVGIVASESKADFARSWVESHQQARGAQPVALPASEKEVVDYCKKTLARATKATKARHRADAFFAVNTLHQVRTIAHASGAPLGNDSEDVQLLMQLATPAFIATKDLTLIGLVDDSGTYQAPWVRTADELLVDTMPEGLPWGVTAKRAHARFVRAPREELAAREEALISRLRRPRQ